MADVLQLEGGAASAPIGELVRCVDREVRMRVKVYQRWVSQGKMTPVLAQREMALMMAVRERLLRAEAERTVLSGLAQKHGLAHRHLQTMVDEAERLVASQFPVSP